MGFASQFSDRVDSRNDVALIALNGRLDTAAVQGQEIKETLLDLREVGFIGSQRVHALHRAKVCAKETEQRLDLPGATGRVRRVFTLTGPQALNDDQRAASSLDRLGEHKSVVEVPFLNAAVPSLIRSTR